MTAQQAQKSSSRKWILTLVVVALVAFLAWKLHASHFDWAKFGQACRQADWRLLVLAILVIWSNCVVRAMRWAIFLRPSLPRDRRVPFTALIGSQFIGFAGLAIFGRIGELIRPYLIARRTGLTLPSQIAVVAVERIFDLGAFALIFTLNLLLASSLNNLPYHDKFHAMGYAIAAMIAVIAIFIGAVWFAGGTVAKLFQSFLGLVSKSAGEAAGEKILSFRDGLKTIDSVGDFISVALLSLVLWGTITVSYVLVMRAFPAPVSALPVSSIILLMGFSVVGSVVQLPGIGGGAQALSIGALAMLFSIPRELAFSSGMILWVITTMSIIPAGLLFARLERVSLGKLAHESEAAGEKAEHTTHA